jgi:hypothetical protein
MTPRALLRACLALTCAALAAGAAVLVSPRSEKAQAAGTRTLLGVMDDALLNGDPGTAWAAIQQLHPQIIRYDLSWAAIATRKPAQARNPDDPAYQWAAADKVIITATAARIPVVLSITDTPVWAGGTLRHTKAPRSMTDLQNFAFAAASRYDGAHQTADGQAIPKVTRWTAWNEPNTTAHLTPQFTCKGGKGFYCRGGKFFASSPTIYAGILNAIYRGVHAAGTAAGITEVVAGGLTKPTGDGPTSSSPSIAPLRFLRLLAAKHVKFDVWATHPYRTTLHGNPKGPDNVGWEQMPNLLKTLDQLYPGKRYHVWVTEYGQQTNPPDKLVGDTLASQAAQLRKWVAYSRKTGRIDMIIQFLIRDESIDGRPFYGGFQSGLAFVDGRHKPSWTAFQQLAR